jgi:osmotically-inducible protein OsmY
MKKSDAELLEDVMEELSWEPMLNLSDLSVKVSGGILTIRGYVDALWKKRNVESAVKRVSGIGLMVNEITIRLHQDCRKSDESISTFLMELLMWHSAIGNEKIAVEVKNSRVYFSGEVEWLKQKNIITELAESLTGVIEVNNAVTVVHGKVKSDVLKRIQSAFYRHAAFDLRRIFVETEGSCIYLSGEVRSEAEKRDAENAAWATPGVKEVISYLTIEEELSVV